MNVRLEKQNDFPTIDEVVRAAFESVVERELVRLTRGSPNYVPELAFVAEVDGCVVGHVMLSYVELDDGVDRHRVLSLAPLAVAPEFQRRGIGGTLIRAALEAADRRGEPLVVLEGSPTYYPRFGFRPAGDFGISIDLPSWAPPDAAQVFPLTNHDPRIRGHVIYPPAFAQAEALREESPPD